MSSIQGDAELCGGGDEASDAQGHFQHGCGGAGGNLLGTRPERVVKSVGIALRATTRARIVARAATTAGASASGQGGKSGDPFPDRAGHHPGHAVGGAGNSAGIADRHARTAINSRRRARADADPLARTARRAVGRHSRDSARAIASPTPRLAMQVQLPSDVAKPSIPNASPAITPRQPSTRFGEMTQATIGVPATDVPPAPISAPLLPPSTLPPAPVRLPIRSNSQPALSIIPPLPTVPGVASDNTGTPSYAQQPSVGGRPEPIPGPTAFPPNQPYSVDDPSASINGQGIFGNLRNIRLKETLRVIDAINAVLVGRYSF